MNRDSRGKEKGHSCCQSEESEDEPMPYHIKSIKGTGKLYVSSRARPWIWVLDQDSLQVLRKIPINGEGHQMVMVQR